MSDITKAQLQAILTTADAEARAAQWIDPINSCMKACDISTPLRQAAFLAQVLLESSEFHQLQESLSYSAERLRAVWPQRFTSDEIAAAYSHQPEKLANNVYANRMGNGPEASGDGWAYRGRGLIQLTGRQNYASFSKAMGIDAVKDPDLLQQPTGAAMSAAWFWQAHGLNELADKTSGADADENFRLLTQRINGGTNGLPQRRSYWQRALTALGVR
ncbi:putative chitinase [Duganella sacchari]|uniref:Putative chitinase n=1 Tax=Duganella sacchari TaxID=551987 RepID=A0A1M7K850_9BURK|nr:glycoside hydrolase family 19 protein [Duganella sacchari]SHM61472.1 putative chitinase [Duganella sacchari]